jgi:hypothetical protein
MSKSYREILSHDLEPRRRTSLPRARATENLTAMSMSHWELFSMNESHWELLFHSSKSDWEANSTSHKQLLS